MDDPPALARAGAGFEHAEAARRMRWPLPVNIDLLRLFDAEATRVLGASGWRRKKRGVFTQGLAPEIEARIYLEPKAIGPEIISIHVFVSVRHNQLERLVGELMGEKVDTNAATIGYAISWLISRSGAKDSSAFHVRDDNLEQEATRVRDTAERYGRPVWNKLKTTQAIAETLEEPEWEPFGGFRYVRPVAWYLAGDAERARRTVRDVLAKLDPDRDWVDAPRYPAFAERLLARLDAERSRES